jgi:hypothetical protein
MKMCGRELEIGDYVEVKLTGRFSGTILKGTITKLWDTAGDDLPHAPKKQAQINGGWCFHEEDEIIQHVKAGTGQVERIVSNFAHMSVRGLKGKRCYYCGYSSFPCADDNKIGWCFWDYDKGGDPHAIEADSKACDAFL